MAERFLKTSLLSYDLLDFLPSQLAAGAIFNARLQQGEEYGWNQDLEENLIYTEEDVLPVAQAMWENM